MIDFKAIDEFLTEAAERYEKTAPTVTDYINDLYARMHGSLDKVRLSEVTAVMALKDADGWEHCNYAANRIYKLMHRLGMDTTGHAGF